MKAQGVYVYRLKVTERFPNPLCVLTEEQVAEHPDIRPLVDEEERCYFAPSPHPWVDRPDLEEDDV